MAERQKRKATQDDNEIDNVAYSPDQSEEDEWSDSSDSVSNDNTVGNIPLHWYDDYDHIGYDLDGKKIAKPAQRDKLDTFLAHVDEEKTNVVYNPLTGEEIEISADDIQAIKNIQSGRLPNGSDPYEDYVDFFTGDVMDAPVSGAPEPKRRFIPSKWEHKKVMSLVRAIRKGWLKPNSEADAEDQDSEPVLYDVWADSQPVDIVRQHNIPAPKLLPPGHEQSYNPPEEYLPNDEERKALEENEEFVPQKFTSLRLVPAYGQFMQERFHRCLDLYLCPRAQKKKLNIDPDSLIPKLPSPSELKPFPSRLSRSYSHPNSVRSISFDPSGQFLATGCDDGHVRIFEVSTGRVRKDFDLKSPISCVCFSPTPDHNIILVAVEKKLIIINPNLGSIVAIRQGDRLTKQTAADSSSVLDWTFSPVLFKDLPEVKATIEHHQEIQQVVWHHKGNYFATVCPTSDSRTVTIHSLHKKSSQHPLKKKATDVQRVCFHPSKPVFFVATKTHVRVYDLQSQSLQRTLLTGAQWISSMAVHPGGDNLIIGSMDRRLCWFDLDLANKPYKSLRYHRHPLRSVAFHKQYPLFASCSDDGSAHVFHGQVYMDLNQNPLIVPVKILKSDSSGYSCKETVFHPRQPWLALACTDGQVRLYI